MRQSWVWRIIRASGMVLMLCAIAWSMAVRLRGIDVNSYWFDEFITLRIASHSPLDIFTLKYHDVIKPTLYPLLLSLWIRLFGDSELHTRLLSVVFSVISCGAFTLLAQRTLRRPFFVLFTVLLFCVTNGSVWASQQANYFTLFSLWTVLGLYFWLPLIEKNDQKAVVPFVIVSVLGVLTHYLYLLFLFGTMFLYWWQRGDTATLRSLLKGIAIPLALYAAVYIYRGISGTYVPAIPETLEGVLAWHAKDPPGTIRLLFLYTDLDENVWLLRMFVAMFLGLVWLSYRHTASQQRPVLALTAILVVISFATPLAQYLTSGWYFNYILPGLILAFGIVMESLPDTHKLWGLFFGAWYLYINVQAIQFNIPSRPYWEYRTLAEHVRDQDIRSIAVYDCSLKWLLDYYLERMGDEVLVRCFSMSDSQVRTEDLYPYAATLGFEGDDVNWALSNDVMTRLRARLIQEHRYTCSGTCVMLLREYQYLDR